MIPSYVCGGLAFFLCWCFPFSFRWRSISSLVVVSFGFSQSPAPRLCFSSLCMLRAASKSPCRLSASFQMTSSVACLSRGQTRELSPAIFAYTHFDYHSLEVLAKGFLQLPFLLPRFIFFLALSAEQIYNASSLIKVSGATIQCNINDWHYSFKINYIGKPKKNLRR